MPQCPICHKELSVIKAGVSKSTGKPYLAFYACPNKCNLRGVMDTRVQTAPQGWANTAGTMPQTPVPTDGFKIMSDEFINLKDKIEELLKEIRTNVLGQ
ncbi:MAG: hypothetical protein WC933_02760 [Candidatus Paceibacterota bacterium]|jgi:hypothetical protein